MSLEEAAAEDVINDDRKCGKILDLHAELMEENPFELFSIYCNDEMLELLITETNRYACQKNMHDMPPVTEVEMRRFCGIFILSGYHTLPSQRLYWSSDKDMSCVCPACTKFDVTESFL